jgi:Protein of unknown function (DUF4242)
MADFLAEGYTPRLDEVALAKLVARLEAAAQAMSEDGSSVRYVRSIHIPEDETCFHLFEAESAQIVERAGRHAGLGFDRIAEAVGPVAAKGGVR